MDVITASDARRRLAALIEAVNQDAGQFHERGLVGPARSAPSPTRHGISTAGCLRGDHPRSRPRSWNETAGTSTEAITHS